MKKVLLMALVSVSLLSCNNNANRNNENNIDYDPDEKVVADTHTSQNSIDYTGTYKGTLPCADCPGIETEVELNDDNTYTKKTKYVDRGDNEYEEKGTYHWDSNSNIITLEGVTDGPTKYMVGEGYLKQLDTEGNEITGDHANYYILRK